jgi:hypothetical protein
MSEADRLAKKRAYHREYQRRARSTPEGREKYNSYTRKYRRRDKYGMTTEAYEAMVAAQHGKCAICEREEAVLSVDHDHAPGGKVRELLCRQCNTMLGMAGDSQDVLATAIAYLTKHANV